MRLYTVIEGLARPEKAIVQLTVGQLPRERNLVPLSVELQTSLPGIEAIEEKAP